MKRRERPTNATAYRIMGSPRKSIYRSAAMLLALSIGVGSTGVHGEEQTDEEQVLAVVQTLFDGMRTKNEVLLRTPFRPNALLGNSSVDDFVAAVLGTQAHLDEVTFDETVLIDGNLAMAWTPYNIFVDGHFQHCGIDLFVLHREDEQWRISLLEDTRRKVGCDAQRRS